MKLAILGDCHFGVRNDSTAFHDLFRKFYGEVFFPYLKEHGIDTVLQTGDLFDRRKYVNFNSLSMAREYFFEQLVNAENHIKLYMILGNHDIFYKNTLEVNSPTLLLGDYSNIYIITKPQTLTFDDLNIDFIPWVCVDNEKQIMEFIKNSKSSYCFGHFELVGFEMDRGNVCHEGWDSSILSQYEQVFTGHFHHRSQKGNIFYVGAPCEHTWIDYNDPKGFHVLDTETREIEFIPNPHTIFRKISYNDEELYFDEVQNRDFSEYEGKYVKVIVVKKTNGLLFESFMDNLGKSNPIDIIVVEDFGDDTIEGLDEIDQADDTMAIIDKVVDGLEMDLQKPRLKSILREIYTEALTLES